MTLEKIKLVDRKRLCSHYPVLLASETGSGKSFAFAQLSPAEKKRTYILNFDGKSVSEDDSEFLKVFHEFDVKDIEMVDKIEQQIITVLADDRVDRLLVDTFTLMTKLFNRWAAEHFSGFDIWNGYNNAITQILECIKSATLTYGKFTYVTAHYPPKLGMAANSRLALKSVTDRPTKSLSAPNCTTTFSLSGRIISERNVYFTCWFTRGPCYIPFNTSSSSTTAR